MKSKSLSPLGYFMEALNIQTVSLARFLVVDASLVSKWKTGVRSLSEKSVYLDNIIKYLFKQSESSKHETLKNAIMNLYPHEKELDNNRIKILLRKALTGTNSLNNIVTKKLMSDGAESISTLIYQNNSGRRMALLKLLDYAEK